MSSLQAESDLYNELNDSGFAQDEPMMKKQSLDNIIKPQLLDLSDDVLLYILKYCDPRDLKSLGFTCSRLGSLVLDRTLWERVDARSEPVGPKRLRWYMKHGLSSGTTELLLSGYAREAKGCLGHMNCEYKEVEKDVKSESDAAHWINGGFTYDPTTRRGIIRGGPVIQIYDTIPRATCFPLPEALCPDIGPEWAPPDSSCPGPQYTLTQSILRDLVAMCPAITSLALEYCNVDCTARNIAHFPRTLKKLSLRGSKSYNQPMDKSFLFKIHGYLTNLEDLDVSECEWIEPSSLLPLSKLPALRRLNMRRCCRLTECVAYSSLAARYGFKCLEVIDLRESAVGDSEVSSFGWVSTLQELYVSPATHGPREMRHAHYVGDVLPEHVELDPWEEQEPEYFKSKQQKPTHPDSETKIDEDTHTLKRKMDTPVVCSCGARNNSDEIAAKKPKSSDDNEVNDGASTSKWTPSEEPPPLRYFKVNTPEPSMSMESEMELDDTTETPGTRKSSAMETTEIVESAGSSGTSQSSVVESFDIKNSTEATLPDSQSSTMVTTEIVESAKTESPSTSQSSGMEFFGTSKSSEAQSSDISQLSGIESLVNTKSYKADAPSTSQLSGLESYGATKAPESPLPSTSQSSGMESSGTTKAPESPSPSTSQSSGMESSGTTKSPESPSRSPRNTDSPRPGPSNQAESGRPNSQRYVRFRQNRNPVVVIEPDANNRNQEAIQKILYVNVGRRLHSMYRLTMPVYAFADNEVMGENARRFDAPYTAPRLDPRTLVSDTTVQRFGRADNENISYINIGPNGIHHEAPGNRPDRSNLRVLSMTGFRNITNRSLVHLATAAPLLTMIDFSGTRVTECGVANFLSLRPDCKVIYDKDV